MTGSAAGGARSGAADGGGGDAGGSAGAPVVHPDVAAALSAGSAVVALESSVLAQGLPIPANREAAQRMAAAIRSEGAIPAMTAVIAGVPCVGIDEKALEMLLSRENVSKVSSRDLPVVIAKRENGATTVAATLALARAAGVTVFATGGIGGVQREPPFDESADLHELARTSMVVVCAGAKSILDLPATFERLETLGVTVLGFRTGEAPGFFTSRTGIPVPARVESPSEVAAVFRARLAIGIPGAVLVLNPPPAEHALPAVDVERAVADAVSAARRDGISGGSVTPYLLAAMARATGGASLQANLALLESNATLGAGIAVALARSGVH